MVPAPAVCRLRAGVRDVDTPRFGGDLSCVDLEGEVVAVVEGEEVEEIEIEEIGTASTSSSSSSTVRALQ